MKKRAAPAPVPQPRPAAVSPVPGVHVVTPLDTLLPYQRAFADDGARFLCGCWSRQTGKDHTGQAVTTRDCFRRKTTWMVAAPSERQAVESFGKARQWAEAWNLAVEMEQIERAAPQALMKSAEMTFSNGSRIIAVPGRPDTVRGFSANVMLTEFAFFDDPDATWRAIFPSLTNPLRGGEKRMIVLSTPNGKSGRGKRFYEIVRDNLLEPRPERKVKWSVHRVPLRQAIAQGLPVDYDQLAEAMADPIGVAQELDCEFLDGTLVLLPYDLIALAESTAAHLDAGLAWYRGHHGPLYGGLDFGRTGDPSVWWCLEKVGELLITREVLVLDDMPSNEQEQILRPRIEATCNTCYDYTGPGIGLGDYLVANIPEWRPDQHKLGKLELCTFTAQFKRELFPPLRRSFEAPTRLRIPVDVEVREDLHGMQQVFRGGQISYDSKRTAEGHSDRCVALALANRAALLGGGQSGFSRVNVRSGHSGRTRLGHRRGVLV